MNPRTAVQAALLAALGLGVVTPAAGQPANGKQADPPLSLSPSGSELFRGLFHFHGVKPVDPVRQSLREINYKTLIVVVLGPPRDKRNGFFHPGPVAAEALRRGGAVLVAAEDEATLTGYFPDPTHVEVTGEQVYCPDPTLTLGRRPECPFVVPKEPDSGKQAIWSINKTLMPAEWTLLVGLRWVATNVPTTLRIKQRSKYIRTELAGYPAGCLDMSAMATPLPADRLFAVAGTGVGDDPPFRCLVLADPSVFHNQMMVVPDDRGGNSLGTDNLAFANNVVQFLKGPQGRSQCLFVEAGRVRTRFDDVNYQELATPEVPPVPPIPVPPPPDILNPRFQQAVTDGINRRVAGWEDRNGPNQAIVGSSTSDRRFANVLWFLAVMAAVVVLFWLLRRVWAAGQRPEVSPIPSDTGRVAASGEPGSLARRKEELLQTGQYADILREYLQELFAARGLPLPVPKPVGQLPPVEVTGPGAKTLRGHLRILWEVAFGPHPQPVSYARWKELEPMLDAVRRAADEGRWRFVGGSA